MAVEIKIPAVGESITEVSLGRWLKKEGDYVEQDEVICELESEKANFEITAEEAGRLHTKAKEGDTLPIGALIGEIVPAAREGKGTAEEKKEAAEPKAATSGRSDYAAGHPSPAAAKILSEKGIALTQVAGSGVEGRITKGDAEKASVSAPPAKEEESQATPTPAGPRQERRERMSNLRKVITKRLVAVKNETAMLTTFNEVDMRAIMDIRKQYKEAFKERYEVGLGFMSFFTRAICLAVKDWPAVNARIEGEEIVYSDFCDVSIAVSTPQGLSGACGAERRAAFFSWRGEGDPSAGEKGERR